MDANRVAELVQNGLTWPQAIVICVAIICAAAVAWKFFDYLSS